MSDEKDLINKINSKKINVPFLREGLLDSIHETITNKLQRIDNSKPKNNNTNQNKRTNMNNKADNVISADKKVRAAIQDLAVSLFDLNDKDIAQKLIAEHIFILNNIFKEFE